MEIQIPSHQHAKCCFPPLWEHSPIPAPKHGGLAALGTCCCVCEGAMGKNTFPGSTTSDSVQETGLVAPLLPHALSSAAAETTYSLLGGWRRSNSTSALFSRCLHVGHSLQPGLSERSITPASHLHRDTHRQCHCPKKQGLQDPYSPPGASTDTEQGSGSTLGRQSSTAVPPSCA